MTPEEIKIRDDFAKAALAALISTNTKEQFYSPFEAAKMDYIHADEMMNLRTP